MKVEVLGSGCKKCNTLAELVAERAQALQLEIELEKVSDMATILEYGVMSTPAIVINGEVKVSGGAPTAAEIDALLQSH
ncbi:small redox-active disulfide protein 2 [Ferrimonas sediminum]|uniref:Small redox-active disulfide protein 2 n=1 Tax=Ferrimonas sediminum TaxID=718193 RepID=A0A1G8KLN2_9GAMM|nr:thioredoxin family protein [Ferrimonas sediminum]SDI44347.1 small redox-active disulfide protein 2 [Ferrimonas sediminum]